MIQNIIIRELINFIEQNLDYDLSQEALAHKTGYSKYHLHRIFKKEVGMSFNEYIRHRRLATSAQLLLYTEMPILEIALTFRFNSQEAFSRAFKEVYALSPGKYRKLMSKIILEEEKLDMNIKSSVKGWILSGSNPEKYEMGIDKKIFNQGETSGYIKSIKPSNGNEFGTMMQMFKSDQFKGKRLKLSSFIKTEDVVEGCGMWMRIDDALGDILQFDNMQSRFIKDTTEWNHYSIVLDVPENSATIHFGILLIGEGKVWADKFQFSVVDENVSTTNLNHYDNIPENPINLSFEE